MNNQTMLRRYRHLVAALLRTSEQQDPEWALRIILRAKSHPQSLAHDVVSEAWHKRRSILDVSVSLIDESFVTHSMM